MMARFDGAAGRRGDQGGRYRLVWSSNDGGVSHGELGMLMKRFVYVIARSQATIWSRNVWRLEGGVGMLDAVSYLACWIIFPFARSRIGLGYVQQLLPGGPMVEDFY